MVVTPEIVACFEQTAIIIYCVEKKSKNRDSIKHQVSHRVIKGNYKQKNTALKKCVKKYTYYRKNYSIHKMVKEIPGMLKNSTPHHLLGEKNKICKPEEITPE